MTGRRANFLVIRRLLTRAAVAAVACAAASAYAAPNDAVVISNKRERQWLTLEPIRGALDLRATHQRDSSSSGGSTSSTDSLLFAESLSLSSGASILSPNFINLNFGGSFGLTQQTFNAPDRKETTNGTLYTYDVSADILRNSSLPVFLYARQTQDLLTRNFASALETSTSEYGANLTLRSDVLPTWLRIYHTETTQRELSGVEDYTLSQDNLELHTEADIGERQHLTLDYRLAAINQNDGATGGISDNYTSHDFQLGHAWDILGDGHYTLATTLSYNQQDGNFASEHLHFDTRLRARHSPTFETYYDYTYDQRTYQTSELLTHRLQSGFQHRLFESLVTTGQVAYDKTGSDTGGDSDSLSLNLGFGYSKKVPLGRLNLDLNLGYRTQNFDGASSVLPVLDDARTFSDDQPILLTAQGVDPASLVIRDSRGIGTYVRGVDYTVDTVRNRIEIRRIFGGAISRDEAVLLNYAILPQPPYTSDTTTLSLGGRYDFDEGPLNGLGVFARYFQQDQSISSDIPTSLIAENVTDITYGVDYRIWKLTLTAEQQKHDSNITPYNATRLRAVYTDRFGQRIVLRLHAAFSAYEYPNDGTTTDLMTIGGNLDYYITRELRAIVSALYRNENDSSFGQTTGFEQQVELRWQHRQTDVFMLLRNTMLDTTGGDSTSLLVQFGIRRVF